jgi:hypothetical protein
MKYLLIILALFSLAGCGKTETVWGATTGFDDYGFKRASVIGVSTDGDHYLMYSCVDRGVEPTVHTFIGNNKTHKVIKGVSTVELHAAKYGGDKYAEIESIEFSVSNFGETMDEAWSYCRGK